MAELDSQPKTIQSLYSWHATGKLFVNRRYQRKLVWTLQEKQKLVESVLRGYPIPAVLVAERDGGSYEIIDGLQRLHTLTSFVENAFRDSDGRCFDVKQFPTARTRSDAGAFEIDADAPKLSGEQVSEFLDYSLSLSIMRGASEDEIDDVFGRINTYGHRLSDQERRQAGVQSEFATLVRELAAELRGDVTTAVLPLEDMPSISIDLPKSAHGYQVQASDVYWVKHGVLTSTDLRDSMDEQAVADLCASIVLGEPISRDKKVLDEVYGIDTQDSLKIEQELKVRDSQRLRAEVKYCIDQIDKVCGAGTPEKLRKVIFGNKKTTNPFPSVHNNLVIALFEALVLDKKRIADYAGLKKQLTGLHERIGTTKKSTPAAERRKNIDSIKGLLKKHLVKSDGSDIYDDVTQIDIENVVMRSIVETSNYELKQGLLRLDKDRSEDPGVFEKVGKTVCAIANQGGGAGGVVLVGIADTADDASRIVSLDKVAPLEVAGRSAVGVLREASVMGLTPEEYFERWTKGLAAQPISEPLRGALMSSMSFNNFHGLGVVVIRVPPQSEVAYFDDAVYVREGDATKEATGQKAAIEVAARFKQATT